MHAKINLKLACLYCYGDERYCYAYGIFWELDANFEIIYLLSAQHSRPRKCIRNVALANTIHPEVKEEFFFISYPIK